MAEAEKAKERGKAAMVKVERGPAAKENGKKARIVQRKWQSESFSNSISVTSPSIISYSISSAEKAASISQFASNAANVAIMLAIAPMSLRPSAVAEAWCLVESALLALSCDGVEHRERPSKFGWRSASAQRLFFR